MNDGNLDKKKEQVSEAVMAEIRQGLGVRAIKIHQEETGAGLKETYDLINSIFERLREERS